MTHRALGLICLAVCLPAAVAAAGAAEETVISLDGAWRFQPAGGEEADIAVPSFWDRQPQFRSANRGVYRRAFDVPESFQGRRIALRFDAVGDAAEVYINGLAAGGHIGAALPFEVDITALVTVPSKDNRLEVEVRDDTHFSVPRASKDWRNRRHWIPRGMGGNNRKGLYQSVSLRARPPVWVADARIQTSVRKRTLTVIYQVFNSNKETIKARLGGEVLPSGGGPAVVALPQRDVELPGLLTTTVTLSAPFGANITLWQPDHPALYTLRTTLEDAAGGPLAAVSNRLGFRETWFEGIHFYLNGIRCNLRGESPAYGEKIEMFSTREAATKMIQTYQKVNFNVLRFHAMPAPPHVLEICDELGMMVIDESAIYASWQMLMPEHPRWMEFATEHLTRWVQRDRNHPSVVMWSGDNEGLNVRALSPAMLGQFRKIIDAEDGTRPVIFDGDGTAYGVADASNKHYVFTIEDLKERGGRSSGYGKDLRTDIYWATEYKQDVPLGIGEFLYPNEAPMKGKQREAMHMMGLQTRGYRLADWFDIRPYNPSYTGFLTAAGTRPEYQEAYEVIVKSFAPVAAFDKDYDALGPYPDPPRVKAGQPVRRTLIVYNDEFADEKVQLTWRVRAGERQIASGQRALTIPLGNRALLEISFTPPTAGELRLELETSKNGQLKFADTRRFVAE